MSIFITAGLCVASAALALYLLRNEGPAKADKTVVKKSLTVTFED